MSIVSLAIVGKNNEPLYVRQFEDESSADEKDVFGFPSVSQGDRVSDNATSCSIRHQFILHEALERLKIHEESGFAWRASGATGSEAMFVGLLSPIEDMRVYGQSLATWKESVKRRHFVLMSSFLQTDCSCSFLKTNTLMVISLRLFFFQAISPQRNLRSC
jgi:hypothetical protein